MIDINAIVNAVIATAVAEAVTEAMRPLINRIDELENRLAHATPPLVERDNYMMDRIETLELAFGVHGEKLTALEQAAPAAPAPQAAPLDAAAMADALNTQEWFWEKINNYVDARIEKAVEDAIDEHNNNSNHKDDHDIENMIDEAIDRHERNNTHGTADESVRDAIQEVLDGARVTLRF